MRRFHNYNTDVLHAIRGRTDDKSVTARAALVGERSPYEVSSRRN